MKAQHLLLAVSTAVVHLPLLPASATAAGDPERGAQVFRACAACHSLEPGRHLTGPSLGNIFGRKAATVPGFERYSEALEESGIVWNEKNLDAWLRDPQALVPGNTMTFPGIRNPQARADLIAFLKRADAGQAHAQAPPASGMGGMMAAPQLPDLQQLPQQHQVTSIRYCRDSYFVTTADGETTSFWEFNLRFKTDSNPKTGPGKRRPVIIGAGMRGDRAAVVFANPEEISRSVQQRCE